MESEPSSIGESGQTIFFISTWGLLPTNIVLGGMKSKPLPLPIFQIYNCIRGVKTKAVGKSMFTCTIYWFSYLIWTIVSLETANWPWIPNNITKSNILGFIPVASSHSECCPCFFFFFHFFLAFCRGIYLEFVKVFSLRGCFCDASLGNLFGNC